MSDLNREYERLVVAYTHLIDFGEAAKVADLFAEDGLWESDETRMDGRDAIRRGFGARQRNTARASRHVCTNLAVHALDEDTADGVCYFTLYRHDGEPSPAPLDGPAIVGQYRDRLVRTPEGWLIHHRRAQAAFVRRDPR